MINLVRLLGCGKTSINREGCQYRVVKFLDLTDKIIPLFKTYKIEGDKFKDFNDFCRVAELMKNKAHLTQDGLDQIRQIKAGMNTGRK